MVRRGCLKMMLVGACTATAHAQRQGHPIQLLVDLSVDPAKEQEMLHNFHNVFVPRGDQATRLYRGENA